jgi:hypothetical protein
MALTAYEAAYQAKPLPGFLFNIAQCHRNLGHHERAVFFYRRYLSLDPESPNRALVEQLASEEEKKKEDTTSPASQAAAPGIAPPAVALAPSAAPSPPPSEPPPSPPPEVGPAITPPPSAGVIHASDQPPLFVSAAAAPSAPERTPVYKRWWFWTAIGAVTAAGAVTALLVTSAHQTSGAGPMGNLPVIDWR